MLLVLRQYALLQFVPATRGLRLCVFVFENDKSKKQIIEISKAWAYPYQAKLELQEQLASLKGILQIYQQDSVVELENARVENQTLKELVIALEESLQQHRDFIDDLSRGLKN
ncbi:hypothetical protein GQ457_15G019960 [Hibiscus cannabinus]